LKVLVVFHGMPPIAGRTVVGSGLRAFANGEALRAAGHEVLYCTRHEDLPAELKAKARRAAPGGSLLLTAVTGPVAPPGDRARRRPPPTAALDAVLGPAPAAIGMAPDAGDPSLPPDWMPQVGNTWTPVAGLAPVGGPLGAPGNPLSFTEPHELQANIAKVAPDVVLVESIEDARSIPEGSWAVILDLFAPRLLEQQFQTGAADTREAVRILDALQRADRFLFSNARQKYFHLPLLALAGVDCTRDGGDVVSISCPPDSPPFVKPTELTFVAGGVFWPWADLSGGLRDLLACLDRIDAGAVRLYGGEYGIRSDTALYSDPRERLPKDHARVEFVGMVPIDTLWEQYRRGSVAFDLMAPNPEREINLSFRQVDYLRCGLPIITAPSQVIARDLEEYGAGWLIEPDDRASLERLVRKLVTNPKLVAEAATAAQALARDKYAWTVTGAALVRAVESAAHRTHGETLFGTLARTQADLWEEFEDAKRLRTLAERQSGELDKKSAEVEAQDTKIRQLLTTVDRLTLSLEEVARFRSDTVGYLAQEQDTSLREAAELQRELDRRDLDVRKKDAALGRVEAEVDKLKASTAELEDQNRELQAKYGARDADVLALTEQRRAQLDRLQILETELAGARREIATKEAALADLAERMRTQEATALTRNQRAEEAARKLLTASESRLGQERDAHGQLRQEAAELAARVASLERDLRKKSDELALAKGAAAKALELQVDGAQAELARAHASAEQVLRQATTRLARVDEERARLRVQVREFAASAADAERRLELERDRAAAEAERIRAEAARALELERAGLEREITKKTAEWQARLDASEAARVREVVAAQKAAAVAAEAMDAELARERERHAAAQALHERESARLRAGLEREITKKTAEWQARLDASEAARLAASTAAEELHATALQAKDAELARERERHEGVLARELAARDAALRQGERLRTSLESRFLAALGNAEEAAQASLEAAVARTDAVLAARGLLEAQVEELRFERAALRTELDKKSREVEVGGRTLGETRAELEAAQLRIAELTVQVEQKDYAVRSLSADADKKSRELDAARTSQRELQGTLERVASTLRAIEAQRDHAQADLRAALAEVAARDEALVEASATIARLQGELDAGPQVEEPDTTPPAPPAAQA
jgi:hypothetical protein